MAKTTLLQLAKDWLDGKVSDEEVRKIGSTIEIFKPIGLHENLITEPDVQWDCNNGNSWFEVDADLLSTDKMTYSQRKKFASLVLNE
ncbi:hypothetical protein FD29_GL000732 [Companilactobacillus mindensis DSM 14500]|uniref:Uncharacterized protein n=1 Tax=Companilactobacillus mindensis DSM 14500 TaxID=1423770 RepID=A0A0R1QQX4_9LACO|nr:hypothetical protein [Companilactobacillus mindensis]KRL43587.1 hypothetical protein FD29_GL000732 [Companilactobacillus mindensis DSM 14500]GEO78665.1 hypothetical protein LMI01_09960 [Companilactobacillus mindensis]